MAFLMTGTWYSLLLAGALCLAAPAAADDAAPLTAEQREQLQESERLRGEARQLEAQGQLAEARAAVRQALAVERRVLGDVHDVVGDSLTWLARMSADEQDFAAARPAVREALAIRNKLHGEEHYLATDARVALADVERLAALSPEQQRRLAEARRLMQKRTRLFGQRHYREALPIAQEVLETNQAVLGENSERVGEALHALGLLYKALNDYEHAESFYRRASAVTKQVFGEKHPRYGIDLTDLGILCIARGSHDRAEAALRQAATVLGEQLGPKHRRTVQALNALEDCYARQAIRYQDEADFAAARTAWRRRLDIITRLHGVGSWQVTNGRSALGNVDRLAALSPEQRRRLAEADRMYRRSEEQAKAGELDRALESCRQALALHKELLGEEHVAAANSLNRLAVLYEKVGDFERALPAERRALEIYQHVYGEDHPTCLRELNNLGMLSLNMGDFAAAQSLLRRAAEQGRKVLGPRHPDVQTWSHNLIDLYRRLADQRQEKGDYAAAAGAWHELVALKAQLLGADHWEVTDARLEEDRLRRWGQLDANQRSRLARADRAHRSMNELAARGKYREALQQCRLALETRQELLGESDRLYANTLAWLGHLHVCLKEDARAEPPYRQAAEFYHRVLGNSHPDTVKNLKTVVQLYERLAAAYEQKEAFAEARTASQALLELRRRLYGAGHWQVTEARLALALLERKAALDAEQRRRLAQGDQAHSRGIQLVRERKYKEALEPFEHALEIRKELLGDANGLTQSTLASLGWLYYKTGDAARAEPLLKQAVAVGRQLGEGRPGSIQCLYALTEFYQASGDYDRAEALLRRALIRTRELGGEGEAAYDTTFESLVALYASDAGRFEGRQEWTAARRAREKVVALLTYRHGPSHWKVTDARLAVDHSGRLAVMSPEQRRRLAEADALGREESRHFVQGKYREALAPAEQAVGIYREVWGKEDRTSANWLITAASLHSLLNEPVQAEPAFQQALAIQKQVLGDAHPDCASTLESLAGLCLRRNEHDKAEALSQQALNVRQRALGEAHPLYAQSLANLAQVYQGTARYAEAERLLLKALEITRKKPADGHASNLQALALVYTSMGDYARAEPLYQEALAVCRDVPGVNRGWYASGLEGLAGVYRSVGEPGRAEALFREALEVRRETLGEDHPLCTGSLLSLADLYLAQGDPDRAEPLVQQALQIRKRAYGEDHTAYAKALGRLAWVYTQRGEYDRAEPLYRKEVEIARKAWGETSPTFAVSLGNLANFYDARGNYPQSASLYRQCLAISRHNWELAAASRSERQQLGMARALRFQLDYYLSVAARAGLGAEEVYPYVLAWKGAVFDSQRWRRELQHILQERKPEVAGLYKDLQSTAARLAALAFASTEEQAREDWGRELRDLTNRKERLEAELARRSNFFRKRQGDEAPTVRQLRDSLPAGTALVDCLEYVDACPPKGENKLWTSERRVVAFVVRADGVARVDLGPAQRIAEALEPWRLALQRRFRTEGDERLGARVRELVWQPLEAHLRGVRVVLVSPDGALARVSLPALPGEQPHSYLIEELSVAVVPVPRLLPELFTAAAGGTRSRSDASLLLLGDVDFGAASVPEEAGSTGTVTAGSRGGSLPAFQPLEGTRAEILALRGTFEQHFPGGHVWALRGEQATKEAFRQQAPQARWLHLATHGFFAPPQLRSALAPQAGAAGGPSRRPDLFERGGVAGFHPGLLSGLVLAGANRPTEVGQESGILTALEVEALDLAGVELAVLSACETGLGEQAGGEGLLGLQRAFQVAGARSAVAGLWQVDDAATRKLMTAFYENLWDKKLPKLEALRQAQLWMLREGDKWMRQEGVSRGVTDVRVPKERLPQEDGRLPPYYWAAFSLSGDYR